MTKHLSPLFTWRSSLIEDERLNAPARHVALTLSLYMSERGDSAFPSIRRLAGDCSRGLSTVSRALADLEEFGWLTVERPPGASGGRGRTNLYRATIPETFPQQNVSSDVPEVVNVPVVERNVPEVIGRSRQDHVTTRAPRKRDATFDALAAEESPGELTPRAARGVGVALAEIRVVAPDVTPEDIHSRAAVYRRLWPGIVFTSNGLAKHWAKCAAPLASVRSAGDIEQERQRRIAEDDAAVASWRQA